MGSRAAFHSRADLACRPHGGEFLKLPGVLGDLLVQRGGVLVGIGLAREGDGQLGRVQPVQDRCGNEQRLRPLDARGR
jgi:hypothetical protein